MPASTQPVTCALIMERLPQHFTGSKGDTSKLVTGVSSPDQATANDLVFLATPKALVTGLTSAAAAFVVNSKTQPQVEAALGNRTLLIAKNAEVAMAAVISEFFLKTPYTNAEVTSVHPSAFIGTGAVIGKGVRVGPNAFIGAHVSIGANSYIGANSVIEDKTTIGESTVVHPLVFIGHSTEIGNRCEIHPQTCIGKEGYGYANDERFHHHKIPHQGRVVLEDDVHIGASCAIDRATFGETRIKAGAKLDNQIHIAHNCSIGKNSLVTAGFIVAGSTQIGSNFVVGGMSAVTGHITITDNVQLAGATVVTKSIDKPGAYGGNPLLPLQQFVKMKVAQTYLDDMRKQLKKVSKHLGLEETKPDSAAE